MGTSHVRSLAAVTVIAIVVACRKAPPSENVNPMTKSGAGSGNNATSGSSPSPLVGFEKGRLLAAAADCALGRYRAFETVARDLETAAKAWAAAPGDDAIRTAARDAFGKAMDEWQQAELFRFGPAAVSKSPGGKDLRDQIYVWPLVSRCRIDETIVSGSYATPAFATSLVSGRGLGALEYLAFYDGTDNGCSSFSSINATGSWAALGPLELRRRKALYASAIASDVVVRAGTLVRAWDAAGGNFRDELVKAGSGSRTYATNQDALNSVNDALFYVEVEVKDLKLARPLGLAECGAADCAKTVESFWARRSKENLKENLAGFRNLFQGCGQSDEGFDAWLRASNAGDVADRMLAAITTSEGALDAIGPSLEDALKTEPEKVRALYTAVKSLTDLLKTEFVTVLNLELPTTSEGDND